MDSIYAESHAAWNEWVRNGDKLNGGVAMAIWEDWYEQYLNKRREQTLVSHRDGLRAMTQDDWETRYQKQLGDLHGKGLF